MSSRDDAAEPLVEFMRATGGRLPPLVPATQPPPQDMPPLPLMVLDALADDAETIYSMRSCGEMAPYGVALVGEVHLLDALRSLLADGLIEVQAEHVIASGEIYERPVVGEPRTTDGDLRRYWFRMTPAGRKSWEAAADVVDAYWDTHPLEPRANDGAPQT